MLKTMFLSHSGMPTVWPSLIHLVRGHIYKLDQYSDVEDEYKLQSNISLKLSAEIQFPQ